MIIMIFKQRFLDSVSFLLCSSGLLNVNINWAVISVEKGNLDRLSSVSSISQRISSKMKSFLNFVLFCFPW